MTDLLKSDSLLAIVVVLMGLVSTVEDFWQKIILIVLAIGVVALRSYQKSQEEWRK